MSEHGESEHGESKHGESKDTGPLKLKCVLMVPAHDKVIGDFVQTDIRMVFDSVYSENYRSYYSLTGKLGSRKTRPQFEHDDKFELILGISSQPEITVIRHETLESYPTQITQLEKVAGYHEGNLIAELTITFISEAAITKNLFHCHVTDVDHELNLLRGACSQGRNRVTIMAYVYGRDYVESAVSRILPRFEAERQENPIMKWHLNKRVPSVQLGAHSDPQERPQGSMRPLKVFEDMTEMNTRLGYAIIQEMEHSKSTIEEAAETPVDLKIMRVPGAQDRLYLAFIPSHAYPDLRLRVGTQLKVHLNEDDRNDDLSAWDAFVIDSLPITLIGDVTIQLHRRRHKDESGVVLYDPADIEAGECGYDTDEALREAYLNLPTRQVFIQVVFSDKVYRQQLAALEKFRLDGRVEGEEAKYTRWLPTLLGRNMEVRSTTNLFEQLPSDFNWHAHNDLTPSQQHTIAYLHQIPNHVAIIQGPPGTGKTHTLIEVLLPLLYYTDMQFLVVAHSNKVVDEFVEKITARLEALNLKRIVVRHHSADSEYDYIDKHAAKNLPDTWEPRVDEAAAMTDIGRMFTAKMIYDHYQASKKSPDGRDPRMVLLEHSMAMWILKVTGVVKSEWSQPGEWPAFCSMYDVVSDADDDTHLDHGELETLKQAAGEVRADIFKRASIVCSTVAMAATGSMSDQFKPKVGIFEECGRLHDVDVLPISANYPETEVFIFVGDPKQLPPTVLSAMDDHGQGPKNNLASQLQLSMPARLMKIGHPFTTLLEQHRMVETTVKLPSKLFYRGRLIDAPSTALAQRAPAVIMRDFLVEHFNMSDTLAPRLFLDVGYGKMVQHTNGSRINMENAAVVMTLVQAIRATQGLEQEQIFIITPYTAQQYVYTQVLRSVGVTLPLVDVRTIDSVQGAEASIVILDLVFVARPGFVRDKHRLNVALTRHRNALIVVGHAKGIQLLHEKSDLTLKEIAHDFYSSRQVCPMTERMPSDLDTIINSLSREQLPEAKGIEAVLCSNCGEAGHKRNDCTQEKRIVCRGCGENHMVKDCPSSSAGDTSQRTIECHRCGENHRVKDCPQEKIMICSSCHEAGHMARYCPRGPSRRRVQEQVDRTEETSIPGETSSRLHREGDMPANPAVEEPESQGQSAHEPDNTTQASVEFAGLTIKEGEGEWTVNDQGSWGKESRPADSGW